MPTPPPSWFERDPLELAPLLLGGVLRRADASGAVAVRITETEAYRGSDDPGAHTFRGKTARNATMFGRGGRVYCYFTYGMHHAVNIVAGPEGRGWGVLVRAGEVVEGHGLALERRSARRRTTPTGELARGPGNVAQALGATLVDDGAALGDAELGDGVTAADGVEAATWSFAPAEVPPPYRTGPRVGVSGPGGDAYAYPWRFWVPGEPSVSAYRPAVQRQR
ncbi:DNA-3-methyladenine glycosylase [Agrococcus sp. Marseille-Q4369]|uniref:DNA-3-methyladenine glycosylase n=1 Tax=Agrococcus sp. Marseille-Q4369 TaxID=2810513 RepID=UPI001B8C8DAD|nr:DNA-3-methyladenine glycosylase [Agrococcus sp. Marseille-Q4369]QUW19656.1 DNA-3-methyladenine glycosylase [Agrococcus sp. Marseille-Q4369]